MFILELNHSTKIYFRYNQVLMVNISVSVKLGKARSQWRFGCLVDNQTILKDKKKIHIVLEPL